MVRPRRPRGGARADGLEAAAADGLGDLVGVEVVVLVVVVGDGPGTELLLRPAAGIAPVLPAVIAALVLRVLVVVLAVVLAVLRALGGLEGLQQVVGVSDELVSGLPLEPLGLAGRQSL